MTMRARAFAAQYTNRHSEYSLAAAQAASLIRNILADVDIHPDLISSRSKTPLSLRRKLLEKKYKNPQRQVTDLIGVRVVVLYQHEIQPVVQALSNKLHIDRRLSIDKRSKLQPTQFGYRSVHLIAKLRPFEAAMSDYSSLQDKSFEIQIRSLLEHAWAAIEHECIYKSKINYPAETTRRFAAIAGSLEVLDREFGELHLAWNELVTTYLQDFGEDRRLNDELDTARLVAFLCHLLPKGHGWFVIYGHNKPLPIRLASSALIALRIVGIKKSLWLARAIANPDTRRTIRRYARILQRPIDEMSHLAVICIVVAKRNPAIFSDFFPELAEDPSLKQALST